MYCPHCAAEIKTGHNFCENCGYELMRGDDVQDESKATIPTVDPQVESQAPIQIDESMAESQEPIQMDKPMGESQEPLQMDEPMSKSSSQLVDKPVGESQEFLQANGSINESREPLQAGTSDESQSLGVTNHELQAPISADKPIKEPLESQEPPSVVDSHTYDSSSPTFMTRCKTVAANFGYFFLTLSKRPSKAKKANGRDVNSSLITIILFSLLIACGYYLAINAIPTGFFRQPVFSIMDIFVMPLMEYIILFTLITATTFAGAKLCAQDLFYAEVFSKYGAYLVPFILLYLISVVLIFLGGTTIGLLLLLCSILGPVIIAPTFILLLNPAQGQIDRMYVLFGIYLLNIVIFGTFIRIFGMSLVTTFMQNMLIGN